MTLSKWFHSYIGFCLTERPFVSLRTDAVMSLWCTCAGRPTGTLAAGTTARLHIAVHATVVWWTQASVAIHLSKQIKCSGLRSIIPDS